MAVQGKSMASVWATCAALMALCGSAGGSALAAAPAAAAAGKTPVVLAPGYFGFGSIAGVGYWGGLPELLEDRGHQVFVHVPVPIASPEQRGRALLAFVRQVKERTAADKVVVLAHSQGGVDARVALALGGDADIAAVASLSAPHAGTPIADLASLVPEGLIEAVLNPVGRLWQAMQGIDATSQQPRASVVSLSTEGMAVFNIDHTQNLVPYFTVAAVTGKDVDGSCDGGLWQAPTVEDELTSLMLGNRLLITALAGAVSHDGVVPTGSMRFGTFLGCVPADHGDWMGWSSAAGEDARIFDAMAFEAVLVDALVEVADRGAVGIAHAVPALSALAKAPLAIPTLNPTLNPTL